MYRYFGPWSPRGDVSSLGRMSDEQRVVWPVDAAVMLAVGALSAVAVWGSGGSTGTTGSTAYLVLDVAVAVVATALLPLVLRRPVAGTLAVTVLAALSPAATPQATVGALQVARRRPFRTALSVAVTGVAAHAVQGLWRPQHGLSYGWWLALIAVAYAALVGWGALAQSRRAELDALRDRARRAEAEQGRRVAEARILERTRIAAEMHDVLAHRLSLLATYAGAVEYRPDASPDQLSRAAGVVRDHARQALDELREVILVLREPGTDDAPAPAHSGDTGGDTGRERPQPTLADLTSLIDESRAAGVRVDATVDAAIEGTPSMIGRTAYRVVQEGLTNARKHAPGQPVRLALSGGPGTGLTIDLRNPVTPGPPGPGTGHGLIGLTERVRIAGGRLDHGPAAGVFRLHASLPWPV